MSDEKTDRELRVVLEDDVFRKIDLLKEFHGIRNNTEIIRFLITKEYRKLAPFEPPSKVDEKVIGLILAIYAKYRESGELQLKDIATVLNIPSETLLKHVAGLKEIYPVYKSVE